MKYSNKKINTFEIGGSGPVLLEQQKKKSSMFDKNYRIATAI